jgi:DNA primase catalytic core
MARIPEEVIERLKEEVSLQRLVELAGVELRRQGKDLVGLCPFHEERTGSLVISPEKNLWHCMGACQAGGSVIDWVMRAEGVSFRHAVELLRDGVAPSALSGPRTTRSTVPRLPSPLPIGADERELLERVVGFYAQTLKESPEALAVLERRGLDDPGLIEEFRLGYANRTLGYRLPAKNRKPGAELRGKLQALGVFRATGHEHLSGSLVIPVGDVNGEVVQLYGRKLRDDLNHRGSSRHLYLPGPRRGVFNAKALAGCDGELVMCESLIDALTFWRHGLRHVTAAFGADGFTDELHKALSEAGVQRVLIAFDRDEAGDRGATALTKRLGEDGVECFRVLFPAGQDANSFATSVEEPAGALAQLLREAVWIGAGEPAARPAPAPVEPEQGGARAQLEQQGDTKDEREQPGEASGVEGDLLSAAQAAAPSSLPPSSPVPAPPGAQPVVKLDGEELRVEIEDRRWRIRGLGKASSFELLRVNVLVARQHPRRGDVFHVDSLDLYSARARGVFARQAGEELGVAEELVARDLGRVLLTCEEHAERAVREAQAPREPEVQLSEQERERALGLLKDPELVARIVADFERVGMVGEQENCLIGYLAAVSRKLDRPLAVIVQSTSAAGKSAL